MSLTRRAMRQVKSRAKSIIQIMTFVFFLFGSSSSLSIGAEIEPVPQSLSLTVYFDGYVSVEYELELDPTDPAVNVTLLGQVFEDVTVVDQEGLPLDYSLGNGKVTVFSLGANQTTIAYTTQDLTRKEGRYWSLEANITTTTTVILPREASVVSLSHIPEIIESSDSQVLLVMPAGMMQVIYVVGVVGTREHAQVVLNDAETTINQIKEEGIIVTEAEAKLQEAIASFNSENYPQAETLGYEAKDISLQINETATEALATIDEASNEIFKAENEGRSSGLNEAKNLLDSAKSAYVNGDYEQASILADQAKTQAERAQKPFPLEILGIAITAVVSVGVIVFRLRKKRNVFEPLKQERMIDVQKIFKQHDLREEEMEAIQFIASKNGQSLEAELFSNLNLPRTTTWRMVRRLDEMGIIEIDKFRRQNLIVIRERYEIKK
jgi:uncharacterized membrane protein